MNDSHLPTFITLLCCAGYLWIGVNGMQHGNGGIPSPCIFKAVTGLPCPSCGTTRSVVQLSRGNIANALHANPLGFLTGTGLIFLPVWLLTDRIRRTSTFVSAWHKAEGILSQKRWITAALIMLVMANWGWTIAKGL